MASSPRFALPVLACASLLAVVMGTFIGAARDLDRIAEMRGYPCMVISDKFYLGKTK